MKKKIAIIGAGIAGLTFANFLKQDPNIEFTLYEREDSLPLDQGYGIQLANNSVSILNKINFKKINHKEIFHPNNLDFYTIKNEKISELKVSKFNTEHAKYTTLKRSTLIEFLKEEIYNQHLRFGKKIKEVSELKGKILIKFDDNTNDLVDYVIGADGIFSNTRSFFEKKWKKPKFKKAIAIRTIINSKQNLNIDDKNISLFLGSKTHLVFYPINQKKELNLVCIVRNKVYDPENIKNLIKKFVTIQNPNLEEFFNDKIKSYPLYSSSKIHPSSNKKVFYIGDAFNGFLPSLAQGAGQSIESAYELYHLIKENNPEITSIYFKNRSRRVKIIKRRSDLNFFIFHFSNSIIKKIRNFLMKFLLKRKFFINRYIGTIYKD